MLPASRTLYKHSGKHRAYCEAASMPVCCRLVRPAFPGDACCPSTIGGDRNSVQRLVQLHLSPFSTPLRLLMERLGNIVRNRALHLDRLTLLPHRPTHLLFFLFSFASSAGQYLRSRLLLRTLAMLGVISAPRLPSPSKLVGRRTMKCSCTQGWSA